ncbi:phosphatidylethanolamine-binding protein [Dichotomocladium elegans]|nr:phosphatidylethanolamine-binding protein [Dichotomocladium elegans]
MAPFGALAVNSTVLRDQLDKGGVTPGVLGEFTPISELRITYKMNTMVRMGGKLTPADVQTAPHVWFPKVHNGTQYTLIMLNAEYKQGAPYLHWLVTNIDGQRPATDIANQIPFHQYNPYLPPVAQDTAYKIVFGLYEQSSNNRTFPGAPADRANFNPQKFALEHALTPVAGLYFYL